jgi:hypothetical protein
MIINLRSSLINTSSLSLYINTYVVVAMYNVISNHATFLAKTLLLGFKQIMKKMRG